MLHILQVLSGDHVARRMTVLVTLSQNLDWLGTLDGRVMNGVAAGQIKLFAKFR